MTKPIAKRAATAALLAALLAASTNAQAQTHRRHEHLSPDNDRPAAPVAVDKRDAVVKTPGPSMGKPYWLALAQCGGIFFKLNVLYTDIAVRARALKPDPTLNNEVTRKLNDAINTATAYYAAAERFLMSDRGIERLDAVLVYADQARAAGDQFKAPNEDMAAVNAAIDSALSATKSCRVVYQACQAAYPKACSDQLAPIS